MCAVRRRLALSARCASSSAIRAGRSAQDHSTRRSTDSNTRSRSSSGAATAGGGSVRPRRRAEFRREPAQLGRPGRAGRHRRYGRHQRPGQLQPGRERRLAADVDAGPDRHPASGRADPVRTAQRAGGLPDPRFAGQHHDLARAVGGGFPRGGQRGQLSAPAEQLGSVRDGMPLSAAATGRRGWPATGSAPSSSRSCCENRRAARTAPARSPVASSRRSSARCAASSSGASAHRWRDQATASAARPSSSAAAASSSSVRSRQVPVLLPCGLRPVIVDTREQLPARPDHFPGGPGRLPAPGRAGRDGGQRVNPQLVTAQPDRVPRAVEHLVGGRAPGLPHRPDRRPQAGAGARVRHVGPQPRGQVGPWMRPRVQREPADQGARPIARGHGERFAVELAGEPATQPQPQHEASVNRVLRPLTLR